MYILNNYFYFISLGNKVSENILYHDLLEAEWQQGYAPTPCLWCSLYPNRMTQCDPPTHWRAVEAKGKGFAPTLYL
jgi:hypothetical protein